MKKQINPTTQSRTFFEARLPASACDRLRDPIRAGAEKCH